MSKSNVRSARIAVMRGIVPAAALDRDASVIDQPQKPLHPKSGPATMLEVMSAQTGLGAENKYLKEELAKVKEDMEKAKADGNIKLIDPSLILRSKWANRHEQSFADDSFKALKDEIEAAGGNIQPIKVRPLLDQDGKFEIVFGHRRHQACLELGLDVLAMVVSLNDQEMFTQMDRENRQRKDLRPYEQGLMYQRALDAGLFSSLRKMAESIGVDVGNLSKAASIAKLPSDVLNAFSSPLDIQLAWGSALNQVIQKDQDIVLARAKELCLLKPRLPAKKVLDHLLEGGVVSNNTPLPVGLVKLNLNGKSGETGSINLDRNKRTLAVNLKNVDDTVANEIQMFIQKRIGDKA